MVTKDATAIIDADGALTELGTTDCVPWWSFTKTVLSITTLRLVEKGSLSLDGHLPDFPFSLRQLLRHEAGLPDYARIAQYHADVAAGKTPWPVERLLAIADANRLRYAPGAGWGYSNIGYLRVSQLIERASGKDLAEALGDHVFGPAGLASPRLAKEPGDLIEVQMGSTSGYHPGWVYHGLVVGTVADAARLLWLLTNNRLLQPSTFAEMIDPHSLLNFRSAANPDPADGLGLMLRAKNPIMHPIGHTGEGPDSKIAVYAKNRKIAALWTSLPSMFDAEAGAFDLLA
ncbi:beta-lactamase family protein [Acidobacteria bacterium AB60]|nr:beta-lactamase family protein [Acidobacteria bacterium AB60]